MRDVKLAPLAIHTFASVCPRRLNLLSRAIALGYANHRAFNTMAKTTTTYKSINEVTPPAKIAPIDRIAAMHDDVQATLASIGGAGNAGLAFSILRQIDSLAAEICSPEFLAILDCTSKASGTGFSFALRFSKDGERKANKEQRGIQKQWAGIAVFAEGVPLLRERISKVHSTVMRKAALID